MFGPEGGSAEALLLIGATELAIKTGQGIKYLVIKHIDANKVKEIKVVIETCEATLGKEGLPSFYNLESKEEKSENYKSLEMSHTALEAMVNEKIVPAEDDLQMYGLIICSAKKSLYSFLCDMHERIPLFNVDEHNVTYVTIVSLIALLDRHCGAFRGYQKDQKILPLVSEFINKFAYRHNGTENEKDHLSLTVTFLKLAEQELEEHGKTLSFVEKLDNIYQKCRDVSEALMPLILELITKEEYTKYIQRANVIDLANEIIKQNNPHDVSLHNSAIKIADSPYKDGMVQCFKDFLASLSITKISPMYRLEIVANKYPLPQFSQEELAMHPPTALSKLSEKLHHQHDVPHIVKYFQFFSHNINWMTSKLVRPESMLEKSVKFSPVTDASDIAKRSVLVPMLLELNQKLSIFQAFCLSAKSDRKHIGDDYINSPHHCNFSIEVMAKFGKLMSNDAAAIDALIKDIELSNPNIMMPNNQHTHFKSLKDNVGDIKKEIAKKVIGLVNLHNSYEASPDAVGVIHPEKYKMLGLCVKIATAYQIMSEHEIEMKVQEELKDTMVSHKPNNSVPSVPSTPMSVKRPYSAGVQSTPSVSRNPSISIFPPLTPSSKTPGKQNVGKSGQDSVAQSNKFPMITTSPSPVKTNNGNAATSSSPPEFKLPQIIQPAAPVLTMAQMLAQIKEKTAVIENAGSKSNKDELKDYLELHKVLSAVSLYAVKMQLSDDSTITKKGEAIFAWTYSLAEKAIQFINKEIDVPALDASVNSKFVSQTDGDILQKIGFNKTEKKNMVEPVQSAFGRIIKRNQK